MASTFAELFSDFEDSVKIYVEKLDVTPQSFMRMLSRGMQLFQRETEYTEAYAQITANATSGLFFIPDDYIRAVEVKDSSNYTIVPQQVNQFNRNLELWEDGHLETPRDYSMRMQGYLRGQGANTTASRNGSLRENMSRIYTIYNRQISVYPDYDDTVLNFWYIPDVHAISINSAQWSTFDTTTGTYDPTLPLLWFPIDTQFMTMFTTRGCNILFAPYEEAFLNYAISLYLKSQGSMNYKVFEDYFWQSVARAKENKPIKFHEGVRDYMFSPYS